MNAQVQKAIENSPVWKRLNKEINDLYSANNRTPSDEEYKAIREMMILRTMMEDDNVRTQVAYDVWEQLRK